MMAFPAARKGSRELISSIRFENFEVSWAGASLWKDLFCFGSEDGRIMFADWQGVVQHKPVLAAPSQEAINGAAFLKPWMSVSTRNEVMLWTAPRKPGDSSMGAVIPLGAHGVIAGQSGYFLAPLGRAGLLFYRPTEGREQTVTVSSGATEDTYFYRLISLQASGGQEVVACAARRGGVAAMEFKGEDEKHTLSTVTFEGLDVVDLCPLGTAVAPEGAVALGRDGTLILFRDVLHDRHPGTVKYESVKGTAYRLLSVHGYLFLLTSEGLYVIANLIDRFLNGMAHNPVTPVLAVPIEAIDVGLGSDQWVWIVMPDGVLRFDVELLDQITPDDLARGELREQIPTALTPDWREQRVEQSSRPVLAEV
jgi:hypothetical protein